MSDFRAKMKLEKVVYFRDEHSFSEQWHFRAVYKNDYDSSGLDENNSYSKFTPNAEMVMSVTNPILHGKFVAGDEFYVDFTKIT